MDFDFFPTSTSAVPDTMDQASSSSSWEDTQWGSSSAGDTITTSSTNSESDDVTPNAEFYGYCSSEVDDNVVDYEFIPSLLEFAADCKETQMSEHCWLRKLVSGKKLLLVLDLDETLLHTERMRSPGKQLEQECSKRPFVPFGNDSCLFKCGSFYYFLYLRPGLKDFLTKIPHLFEVVFYTNGTANYATSIMKYLLSVVPSLQFDLKGIIARQSCADTTVKTLNKFNAPKTATIVVDDRPGVWKKKDNKNVIAVSAWRGEAEDDTELSDLLEVLLQIHSRWYSSTARMLSCGSVSGGSAAAGVRDVRKLLNP